MRSGIAELGRIEKELHNASSDVSQSLETCQSLETLPFSRGSSLELEENYNIRNTIALQSLIQTQMIVKDVNQALDIQEKNMVSRAGSLSRRSQESFTKMHPTAVKRLSTSSSNYSSTDIPENSDLL